MEPPAATRAVVHVVDDDPALAESLKFAMEEVDGLTVKTYPDAEALLQAGPLSERGCLVIDAKLPGLDGLELLGVLRTRKVQLPAVLITTNPSLSLRMRAANASVPIIEKPLLCDDLVDTVRRLIAD